MDVHEELFCGTPCHRCVVEGDHAFLIDPVTDLALWIKAATATVKHVVEAVILKQEPPSPAIIQLSMRKNLVADPWEVGAFDFRFGDIDPFQQRLAFTLRFVDVVLEQGALECFGAHASLVGVDGFLAKVSMQRSLLFRECVNIKPENGVGHCGVLIKFCGPNIRSPLIERFVCEVVHTNL